jgi:hypothetical protein
VVQEFDNRQLIQELAGVYRKESLRQRLSIADFGLRNSD